MPLLIQRRDRYFPLVTEEWTENKKPNLAREEKEIWQGINMVVLKLW